MLNKAPNKVQSNGRATSVDMTVHAQSLNTPALAIQAVSYTYQSSETAAVVRDVNLHIHPGEFHCLVGRSGCGKTTLLKLAAGLLAPQQGQIYMHDVVVSGPMSEVGCVFQAPTLLPWLSVLDNVLLPIRLHHPIHAEVRVRSQQLLERMGLNAMQNKHPTQLSGGQQSRVAIARALVTKPTLLLMDEPFAALDAMTREELQRDLSALCMAEKISVLFVTHDITEAVFLADQIHLMTEGQIQHTLPIEMERPRHPSVRYTTAFNNTCAKLRQAMDGDF